MKKTRGTAEWAYRCNPEGTSLATTTHLLEEHHFLWRSLHNTAGRKTPSVQHIEVGDTIHLYFSEGGVDSYLSSYLVEPPADPAADDAPAVEAVRSGPLFETLEEAGYDKDSELGSFTGFRVKRDFYPKLLEQPPRWIGRNALARVKR